MADTKRIVVNISGNTYTLLSEKKEEETLRIAGMVSEEINGLKLSNNQLTPLMASNLAAMNIAEKLHDRNHEYEILADTAKIPMEKYPKLLIENRHFCDEIERQNRQAEEMKGILSDKQEEIFNLNGLVKSMKAEMEKQNQERKRLVETLKRTQQGFVETEKQFNNLQREYSELKGKV